MVNWFKLAVLPVIAAAGIRLLGKSMVWTTIGGDAVDVMAEREEAHHYCLLAWASAHDALGLSWIVCLYFN